MKILVVCQYYYPEPFRITDICENLVKLGHDVTVLTGLPNYPEGKVLEEYKFGKRKREVLNGVNIIRTFEIGRGDNKIKLFLNYLSYAVSATLKALYLKEKFDVLLVNQLSPITMAIPAIVYKKKHNKKVLFYCLDLWPDSLAAGGIKEDSKIYKIFYKISKCIYNSADTILITSSMFKEYFENKLKISHINIKHLPQYAEDLFLSEEDDKLEKYKTSKSNEKYNLVFAGNIGKMQSVETIINAANELKERLDIIFHIVGEGSRLTACKELVKSLKLNNVIFYGRHPIEEMPKFYELADAMLITLKSNKSLSYTLPGKIQSYMAAGKPIIGSSDGEIKRVIEQANCGFCCNAEDYREFAKKVLEFCDSDKKKEMAMNSKKFYLKNYKKEIFMKSLEESLRELEDKNV